MIGRITPLMTSAQILNGIENAQNQMANTEQELSTGLSINEPSDNPYGASLAVQLNGSLAGLSTYNDNITDGTAWTSTADSAMSNIASSIQRVQELVVEAANGTESASDLSATADEVTQLTEQIKQDANTQYNGQYIFSGSATGTAPYSSSSDVYQGNTGSIVREVGPGTSLQVNANLSSVLGNGQSAGDGGLLDTLRTIASDMSGGTSADVNDLSTQLTNLQNNLSSLTQVQATVGSTQDRLTSATNTIQALQTSETAELSNDEDANMASTMTTFSNEQAAFQAALSAGANIVQSSLMNFLSTS